MLKRTAILVLFAGVATALWFRQLQEPPPVHTTVKPAKSAVLPEKPKSPETTPTRALEVTAVAFRKSLEEPESPTIRVCLTNRSRNSFRLESTHPCNIRLGSSNGQISNQTEPLVMDGRNTVRSTSAGIKIGQKTFKADWIELTPEQSPSIWVNDHQYRGSIRFHKRTNGKILAVNHLTLEDYLASVVDSEMPAAFPDEARKAQAIAARSYALFRMGKMLDHPTHHLFATTSSQKYLGFQYRTSNGRRLAGESANSRKLVQATAGIVCLHHDRLFCTYYSAVCGGQTTEGKILFPDAASLLQSVPCDFCAEAGLYRWQQKINRRQASDKISDFLNRRGKVLGPIQSWKKLDELKGPQTRYLIGDGRRIHQLTAQELRTLFPGMHSSSFDFTLQKNHILVKGQGHGHGVGFCQWGSRGLALTGKTTEQILEHYYPGVELHQLDSLEQYQSAMQGQRVAPQILRTAERVHAQ